MYHRTRSGGVVGGLVDDYRAYLRLRGRSDGTIRAYAWAHDDFGRWLQHLGVEHLSEIEPKDIHDWQDHLRARDLAPRTQQLGANALRNALRWAQREGFPLEPDLADHIETVKVGRLIPKPLAPDDIDRINAYLAPRPPGHRTRATLRHLRTRALWY